MYKKVRQRVFEIIEKGKKGDISSIIFDSFIITLIVLNIISVFIETFSLPTKFSLSLKKFEIFSIVVFTIEYFLRIWTAPCLFEEKKPIIARIKYIFSFMAIIDLLAILPFYIPFIFVIDLRVLRALRIFRLLRLFKFNRYTTSIRKVFEVLKMKSAELISSIFIVLILMLISSALMYSIEHDAQPEAFQNAFSGLWWAIATFTTVGYGDIYPVTIVGKLLGGIVSLLGIGLVAVPTGIISSGFLEVNIKDVEKINSEDTNLLVELDILKKQVELVEKLIKEKSIIKNNDCNITEE